MKGDNIKQVIKIYKEGLETNNSGGYSSNRINGNGQTKMEPNLKSQFSNMSD
jgi:hypothetical protein